jgi:SAM-dependent methyltransferase
LLLNQAYQRPQPRDKIRNIALGILISIALGATVSIQQSEQISKVLERNPQLSLLNGVYQNTSTQIRDSKLSSYIQGAVNDSLNNSSDHSLHSIEIEKLLLTDELRSAFSSATVNFLLSFDFTSIHNTLDLSQGFGGATHFLADKVGAIDCVRIDSGHASLSAKRCSAFGNINYISEDIARLNLPEKHYDLILISQLEALNLSKTEHLLLFRRLNNALTEKGVMVASVKNRNRLNKWMSQGSNSIAYHDLYRNECDTDYSETELESAVSAAGFAQSEVYASFSSPGSIKNLFSKAYLTLNPHALNHFNRLGGIDNDRLNEYLLFKNMLSEGRCIFSSASRFLLIAGASEGSRRRLYDNDFAHYSGLGRKPQWRATTECKSGSGIVKKTLVHKHYKSADQDPQPPILLNQVIEPQNFQSGPLLLDKWISALLDANPVDSFNTQVSIYAKWLRTIETEVGFQARAYDLLPFNIIVDQQGHFNSIDPEWVIDADYDAEFIIFRALFWFAFENKALVKPLAKQSGASTIALFILKFMDSVEELNELNKYVEMEEVIQRQIGQHFRNKSVEYALLQTFDGEPAPKRLKPVCQISWSDDAGIVDEHNSVFLVWKSHNQTQTLCVEGPPVLGEKDVLRIDPIADMGIFGFSSMRLLAQDNTVLWELKSSSEIANASQGLNVQPVLEADQNIGHFIALNDDPHFLFDLKTIPHWQDTSKIELTLSLIHNQYYDNALSSLSHGLSEQNVALGKQIGVLDSKQAEIQYLSSKLANIDQHRQALQAGLHQAKIDHEEHNKNLNDALNLQIERNQQLERDPIIKTVLRCKRLLNRVAAKIIPSR